MDRKLARLIFGSTLAAVSLLWYCSGGLDDTSADEAVMLQKANDIAKDQSEAVRLVNHPDAE